MSAKYEVGQVYHLDPNTVVLESNVRDIPAAAPGFEEAVAVRGVLVPVLGYAEGDQVVIRDGQMRTLAARKAKLDRMPVYIIDPSSEVDRITTQLVTNDARQDLSEGQRATAWRQLSLTARMDEAAIATATGVSRERVATGLKVAGSKVAVDALTSHQLSLDEAALWDEFASDDEALQELDAVAESEPDQLRHTAARIRAEREDERRRGEILAQWAEAGVSVVPRPAYGQLPTRLDSLSLSDGPFPRPAITEAEHRHCAGHVAWLDWGDKPTYGCADPSRFGHHPIHASQQMKGSMTETDKAERRAVIAGNREWRAATTERKAFVTNLLKAKTGPKGGHKLVAAAVIGHTHILTGSSIGKVAAELGGLAGKSLSPHLDKVTEPRAHVLTLARVIAAIEASTGINRWRCPSDTDMFTAYLHLLVSCGYTPAAIERKATKMKAPSRKAA